MFIDTAMTLLAALAVPAQHAPAPRHADPKPIARAAKKPDVAACRRAHRHYDPKTNTYRDARGKRHRCTR